MSVSGTARIYPQQMVHYLRKTVNFNDAGIAAGVKFGTLPAGAVVLGTTVWCAAVFNAGTTNVVTCGGLTNKNEFLASGDMTNTLNTVSRVNKNGGALALTADTDVYAQYTQTGTAATAGQAAIIIEYVPNNDK